MRGRGDRARGLRRRRGRRACGALAAEPALPRPARRLPRRRRPRRRPGPDARRRRGAGRRLGARPAAAPGDRRRLDRLARRDARLHGGGGAAAAGRASCCPGFDAGLPPAVWQRLGADDPGAADHPQHGFRGLADALGFDPAAVPGWHPAPPPAPERNALVSLALRPAPVTDQWRSEGAALAGTLAAACAGLAWVEAPDPRGEALAIALRLREAAETGERAALVTPDRTLARRVTAELGRWGLIPDDSAGRPLAQTPPGVLLRRLADAAGDAADAGRPPRPRQASAGQQRAGRAARAPAADRPARDPPAARRRALDRLGRPRRLGGRRGRRGAGLARLAPGRAGAARARRRAAARRARRAPPGGGRGAGRRAVRSPGARALGEGRRRRGARAHRRDRRRGGRRRCALRPRVPGAPRRADGDARRAGGGGGDPCRHRDLGHARGAGAVGRSRDPRRAQRGHLAAAAGGRPLARPRHPPRDRPDRAPSGGSASRRTTSSRRWARAASCLTRATRDAEAPTVASRWLLRLENLLLGLGPEGEAALGAAKARGRAAPRRGVPARPAGRAGAAGPPPRAAAAGGGAAGRAFRHPGREAGARPLRRLRRATCSASTASTRPAAGPTR